MRLQEPAPAPEFSADNEQTTEYVLLNKLGKRFPTLRETLLKLFAVDLRSLALTRIAVGSLILIDLYLRLPDLRVFYSDDGLVPRSALYEVLPRSRYISLHILSGRSAFEALLFLIAAVFALMLIVGLKSRLATFASWLLIVSLHNRNPFVVHGGDDLLRMLLFWGMFTPWGARYSIDGALNEESRILPKTVLSIGTAALLAQVALLYFFTGLLKNGREWRHEFTAISYVLKSPDFAQPLAKGLASFPDILKVLTAGTLVVEMLGALLLFSPVFTRVVRLIAIAVFFALQLGFLFNLKLGLFPLVSVTALLPFLPTWLFDWLSMRVVIHQSRTFIYSTIVRPLAKIGHWLTVKPVRLKEPLILSLVCLMSFTYVVIDNMGSVARSPLRIPAKLAFLGRSVRIHQNWKLFAPTPPRAVRWTVVSGKLPDDQVLTVFDGSPLSPANPDNRSLLISSYNWRTYWGWVRSEDEKPLRPYAARYFCNSWNLTHAGAQALSAVTLTRAEKPIQIEGPEADTQVTTQLDYQCSSDSR